MAGEIDPTIDGDVLRAYIAHTKQTVAPRIQDDDVVERRKSCFSNLRPANQGDDVEAVPVTRRTLVRSWLYGL